MSTTATEAQSDLASVLEKLLKLGFGIGGIMSLAVGAWMVAAPANWFEVFPGAIGDTGVLNEHFVRDLGGWYLAGGILFLFALTNPVRFGGVALVVTLVSYASHAATHIGDLLTGRLPGSHWIIDTPLVFAPVLALVVLLWVWWTLQGQRHPVTHRRVLDSKEDHSGESAFL
ncbi:MAG: hypothetical protein KY429_06030 [Actinobacteria bacterium]|nr:hypothetical protein [Actinomycetota bacterium]